MSDPGQPDAAAGAPVASVIIPAFEAEAFIGSAIASALAQTLREVEVIVVDDGSSDGTWEAILACARADARVVPLRQASRGGPGAARNAAIAAARGRWLALLDADDLYLPWRLARMVAAAEAAQADLLADNMLMLDFATGQEMGARFSEATMRLPGPVPLIEAVRRDMPERITCGEMFGFFQPIMRRDFLAARRIRYAEDILVGEDFLLYFECIAAGGRFHLFPQQGYVQRMRTGSLSRGPQAMLQLSAANRRMLAVAQRRDERDLLALLRRRQRRIDIDCFALLLERGEVRRALQHAHCGTPARLLRHARAAIGAMQRRRAALRLAGLVLPAVPPTPPRETPAANQRSDAARGAA